MYLIHVSKINNWTASQKIAPRNTQNPSRGCMKPRTGIIIPQLSKLKIQISVPIPDRSKNLA